MDGLTEPVARSRDRRLAGRWALAAVAAGALAGCSSGDEVPATLLDGSRPAPLPPTLREVGNAVLTRVEVFDLADRDPLTALCASRFTDRRAPSVTVIRRVGVEGAGVTFRSSAPPRLQGCDRTATSGEDGSPWCGSSVGELDGTRMTDPRLGLLCSDADGRIVAFAWINPSPGARWLAVKQNGYLEVYTVVERLPVRVSTQEQVRVEGSSATFRIVEYAADGSRLAEREVEARVAG